MAFLGTRSGTKGSQLSTSHLAAFHSEGSLRFFSSTVFIVFHARVREREQPHIVRKYINVVRLARWSGSRTRKVLQKRSLASSLSGTCRMKLINPIGSAANPDSDQREQAGTSLHATCYLRSESA